ncbi:MAG TPA: hypothetical protein VIU11_12770 [Nakamurella sp.]
MSHSWTEHHPHVQGGPAVLDIGGDIGALIVTMRPQDRGRELHLRSDHEPPVAVHTGVWARRAPSGETTTAVFGELRAGGYGVLDGSGAVIRRVLVRGGELTVIDMAGSTASTG